MPCAPASRAIARQADDARDRRARRWLRSSATLLTLTDSAVVPRRRSWPVVTRGFIGSQRLRFDHDLARAQLRSAEMIVKLRAQQRPQLGQRAGGDPLQRRQVGARAPPRARRASRRSTVAVVLVVGLDDAGVGEHEVAPLGAHRPVRRGLDAEVGQQADLAQQRRARTRAAPPASRASSPCARAASVAGVGVEERGVRVVAGEQLHQQLVQVEAAEERGAGQHRMAAGPVGGAQRVHLARCRRRGGCRPSETCRRWNGSSTLRSCENGRLAPLAATAIAALLAREQVEDQARLAPVVVVQHVRRERGAAAGAARHVSAAGRGARRGR